MIFYSSNHISSHSVATNVRKIRDQGSNFSHETEGLLASFATIQKIHISYAPSYGHEKREMDFL